MVSYVCCPKPRRLAPGLFIAPTRHVREWVCVLDFGADLALAGSQLDHAFPETDGSERSQEDTKAPPFEFRRPHEEPPGHSRTSHGGGSGPCGPGVKSRAPDQSSLICTCQQA